MKETVWQTINYSWINCNFQVWIQMVQIRLPSNMITWVKQNQFCLNWFIPTENHTKWAFLCNFLNSICFKVESCRLGRLTAWYLLKLSLTSHSNLTIITITILSYLLTLTPPQDYKPSLNKTVKFTKNYSIFNFY